MRLVMLLVCILGYLFIQLYDYDLEQGFPTIFAVRTLFWFGFFLYPFNI